MAKTGLNQQNVKQEMLKIVERFANQRGFMQANSILDETSKVLGVGLADDPSQQILLTVWHDLFRTGVLSPGHNLDNPNLPFYHLTAQGAAAMAQLSRDPTNPAGYMAHLQAVGPLNPVATSYITEALAVYSAACYRATAVMVGCAAESLVLEIRDALVAKLKAKGQSASAKLQDWRAKTVLDQLAKEIDQRLATLPRPLQEEYSAYWPAFTGQIRMARNDAGHPTSIEPVTGDTVHASLLIFPQLAKLSLQLLDWINTTI
jgi:hypothetical protein